jgi:ubiquinone/menaquinone biosynthesis C-methylase UbiE
MDAQNLVNIQFSSTAENYFASKVHAQGKDLEALIELVKKLSPHRLLDLGCGPGHVSLNLSAHVKEVIAYDLSEVMLSILERVAKERQLSNISCQKGFAEKLPFPDAYFDVIVTRFSAHHWLKLQDALHEIHRVLSPHGTIVIIDVTAPPLALCDTALQTLEILRDASHVRDYSVKEWHSMLKDTGLIIKHQTQWKLPIEFESWVKRINTPLNRVQALKDVIDSFPNEVKAYFQFDATHSFEFDVTWFELHKGRTTT